MNPSEFYNTDASKLVIVSIDFDTLKKLYINLKFFYDILSRSDIIKYLKHFHGIKSVHTLPGLYVQYIISHYPCKRYLQWVYFIDYRLDTYTNGLDFCGKELDSSVIEYLASSPNTRAITSLNLTSTRVGYNGITWLWKSSTFGSLISDFTTYERHTGTPVSIIQIEIANTRVFEQYTRKLFSYPLPLLKDFEITYGHRCIGEQWKCMGYKQIKLLNRGKELEHIVKR